MAEERRKRKRSHFEEGEDRRILYIALPAKVCNKLEQEARSHFLATSTYARYILIRTLGFLDEPESLED